MGRGIFITFEGIEGVGKSTQVDFLGERFQHEGRKVRITREPGGTSVGEAIREILLDKKDLDISEETELLLIFAARAQHLRRVIEPALAEGEVVICDRFTDASYAYQGGGRGLESKRIRQLEDWVQCGLQPDLTFLLDAPADIGLGRAVRRGKLDRFESETREFFQSIRETYLELAKQQPERIECIDASQDLEGVQRQIENVLRKRNYLS